MAEHHLLNFKGNGGNMLQELPDEIKNDYIDNTLLVDNWLHLIVENQIKEGTDNNFIEKKNNY